MKKIIIVLVGMYVGVIWGQNNPEIKTELPNIIPPSPSVAALMKFEEIPVSNYTGVPDINVPLFSVKTKSKDLNFNLSLKYHSSILADDRASDVGLGWSLITGGTVSRTVSGLPDEIAISAPNGGSKVGIYQNNIHPSLNNNYYYFVQNIANETYDYYKPLNQLTQENKNIGNEFLWEAANTNKYDTEHDLWQYNFMGNTGRFYIKKNIQTNLLEVVPLEYSTVKIINHYSTVNNNPFIPTGFTIYDDKGFKYIFDVVETTTNKFATNSKYDAFNLDDEFYPGGIITLQNIDAYKIFNSSFHLSKIFDNNNNLITDYIYKSQYFNESYTNSSIIKRDINLGNPMEIPLFILWEDFPPIEQLSNSTTNVSTKKIDFIDIKGVAKIYFEYLLGRQDNNINLNTQTAYLNSLTIKDNFGASIKKINFEYDYSNTLHRRMILKSLKEFSNNNNTLKTELKYKQNPTNGKIIGKDFWGYLNLIDPCYSNLYVHKRVTKDYCNTDLLEIIKYPTGGYTKFNFEPNTYSYTGDQVITNFFEDEQNIDLFSTEFIAIDGHNSFETINTNGIYKIKFYPTIDLSNYPNCENETAWVEVKNENNQWVSANISALACFSQGGNCCVDFYPEANKEYRIRYANLNMMNHNPSLTMFYEVYNKNYDNLFLAGGGNRIKNIEYFEKENTGPIKIKNYNYNFFEINNQSSGSLVFPKPLFNFNENMSYSISFPYICTDKDDCPLCTQTTNCQYIFKVANIENYTSNNNFPASKTNGGDVGYKNVSLFETNLGKSNQIYYSPIDFPEEDIPYGLPFVPSKNIDYKRGLLQKENIFNKNFDILTEIDYFYDFLENIEYTGISFLKPKGSCYNGTSFKYYNEYIFYLNIAPDCVYQPICEIQNSYLMPRKFLCGLPLDLNTPKITLHPYKTAIGWAKLTSKTTKNYFYPMPSSTPNILETNETFKYNPLNKRISDHTISNSEGTNSKTEYLYHTGNSIHSQNRLSEIETIKQYENGVLLQESKIDYANNWGTNVSFLPKEIKTKKANQSLETKIKFNNYDTHGNALELQQENGMLISYIYAYNHTLPVAKIENMAYSSIPPHLITAIQNATDTGTYSEANLKTALDNLRNHASLSKAMVSTYIHKPLIGISSATDPKGDTQTYHYDSFNRLQFVKDKNGNILSENQYHYRPN